MTTAHEQIRQALWDTVNALGDPNFNSGQGYILGKQLGRALALLESHAVVPRERLEHHANSHSRDVDAVNYINGWNDAVNYIKQQAEEQSDDV